ncbi:PREDICTED: putative uncharacterized protein DDB_G0278921 [Ceratosolen solmsi marchali]|uniref:PCNA-associated factor histone-like domain-containing protein n=1 Tax=Ceratosolen solmsi marchali TaxID=326594 RepID=A0AAJ6YHP7_9HYME|nr:PREDICTED: putative uncharacterized protein DDB_G0278921 [Ceratosolen solmsi marchali]
MVRTKADAATRVAAGSKAPKKSANYAHNNSTSSPTEKGKDNLPVNRYFPRETPSWQKKITSFYDRNRVISESNGSKDSKISNESNKNSKRSSSKLDEDSDMDTNGNEAHFKKVKCNNMESDFQDTNHSKNSNKNSANESMDMDE